MASFNNLRDSMLIWIVVILSASLPTDSDDFSDYPEGYFPFEQNPTRSPPKVRKPPYENSQDLCPGVVESDDEIEKSLNNLCGNLNDGLLPINPMGQRVSGEVYPFDVIKNSTLDFFSRTLPVLKEDATLPKVAKYQPSTIPFQRTKHRRRLRPVKNPNRIKRSSLDSLSTDANEILNLNTMRDDTKRAILQEHFALTKAQEEGRSTRSFCGNNNGMLCSLYNTFTGRKRWFGSRQEASERRERNDVHDGILKPLTPCPSTVEYVTPVFARNYQGVWRYVVQIPYEGYFTQTVETTQCRNSKCHYMSGSCLASPRWVSLLVAEIFYPDALFPRLPQRQNIRSPVSPRDRFPTATRRGQFRHRQGSKDSSAKDKQHCDGKDNIGCFQVRLYYDWFLVPGSCKCWKQDYYAQFTFKK